MGVCVGQKETTIDRTSSGGCFCLSLSACLSDFPLLLWVFYQSSFALRLFQYVFDLRTELTSPRNGVIFKNSCIPSPKKEFHPVSEC